MPGEARSIDVVIAGRYQGKQAFDQAAGDMNNLRAKGEQSARGLDDVDNQYSLVSAARWLRVGMKAAIYIKAANLATGAALGLVRAFKGDWEGMEEAITQTPILGEAWALGRKIREEIDGTREKEQQFLEWQKQAAEGVKFAASVKGLQQLRTGMIGERRLIGATPREAEQIRYEEEYAKRLREIQEKAGQGPQASGQVRAARLELERWAQAKLMEMNRRHDREMVSEEISSQTRRHATLRAGYERDAALLADKHKAELAAYKTQRKDTNQLRQDQAAENAEQARNQKDKMEDMAAKTVGARLGLIQDDLQREQALLGLKQYQERRAARGESPEYQALLIAQQRAEMEGLLTRPGRPVSIPAIERGFLNNAPGFYDPQKEAREAALKQWQATLDANKLSGEVRDILKRMLNVINLPGLIAEFP